MTKLGLSYLRSVLTCPYCGSRKEETIPGNYCLIAYECKQCEKVMKPMPGDCCVFCSYGSIPCPAGQSA